METGFSAHLEPETGFSALVETNRRFSALVETETRFCFLVDAETCFSVHLLLHFRFLEYSARLLMKRAEVVGGLPAAAGAMSYQRPRVQLPRWAGCAAAELH